MILLKACDIVRQFDRSPILDGVAVEVRRGEKIGLVGPNGAGKTTLFQIIAKQDDADRGHVEYATGSRVGILEQDPTYDEERTLVEEVRSGLGPLYELQAEAERAAAALATASPAEEAKLHKKYDALQLELHRLGAYAIDHRVEEVLHGLGFVDAQFSQRMRELSGGQRNRAALARLLLARPDVLLLDEPTNHLDIVATEWLEKYLADTDQAVILVSHDRYFLDKVTTRILELYEGTTVDYPGNFSKYWELKEERNKVLERTFEKQKEFIAKTEDFIRRNHYGQKATQAKDREKKLERLERVDRPREIPLPVMGFGQPRRAGDWVFDLEGVTKGFGGEPLFRDVTLRVPRGERVGIFGPNGAGKTTLLRTILGELEPDAGKVRRGTNVDIAYYDQQLASIPDDVDLIEAVRPANNPMMTPGQIREVLARFALKGEIVSQRVGSLSGGERGKVALARLSALMANVLILDEPTNHLDLWACSALEKNLLAFEGTLLFVSHDRYFLDRVATSLIVFEPGRWRLYNGNYSAYIDSMRRAEEEAGWEASKKSGDVGGWGESRSSAASAPAVSTGGKSRRKRKFPFRKVADIEWDIAEAEARVADLQEEMGRPEVLRDGERMKAVHAEFEATQEKLAKLLEHWEEAVELE
jgi:ATP-binding cassette subfamily F protein 3